MSVAALILLAPPVPAAKQVSEVRLYTLDCGHISLKDMSLFADADEYAGQRGEMAVPCFLIRHPRGTLLWDAGLSDQLAAAKGGITNEYGITERVDITLQSQLQRLGLTPEDIDYLAFSHLHGDHTGNANLFARSTWIVNRKELEWARTLPTPIGVVPASFSGADRATLKLIDFDEDVFGDDTVRILRASGHTPGHQVLMLKFAHSGSVILSGDLYHTRDNHTHSRVPLVNTSRAETLASFDRVAKLVATNQARLIIQHAPEDFAALPKIPQFLD